MIKNKNKSEHNRNNMENEFNHYGMKTHYSKYLVEFYQTYWKLHRKLRG